MNLSKETVKVLLFDLGGVVLEISFANVLESWAARAGVDGEALKNRFKLDSFYEQHECGKLTASEYFASLRQSLDIHLTDEQFTEGWNAIALGEVPGIKTLLRRAKTRFPLYAFSNTNFTHLEYVTSHYRDVLALFERLFASCEMGKRKPTRDAFETVVREIGVNANETFSLTTCPKMSKVRKQQVYKPFTSRRLMTPKGYSRL